MPIYDYEFRRKDPTSSRTELLAWMGRQVATDDDAAMAKARSLHGSLSWPEEADGVVVLRDGTHVGEWWIGEADA